ncbi:alpha/beta hydrolase family protein [Paraliomyxa miuraensis]|uniref:alpha/beta hydrolase family protein n=1 Tax=Paraliomyxa miuraensis TaxID=376150 RepID=UPI00224E9178|nr:prolyl oligopeptidase family serine peptidase [Paraliomyxa miuraensis]MCX4243281.1 prolyl oligopeptidase family serine peptidase [Paraliomyxa miuraensis]
MSGICVGHARRLLLASGLLALACSSPPPNPSPDASPATPVVVPAPAIDHGSERDEADAPASTYRLPPTDVVDIVDAPPTPVVSVAPGGARLGQFTYEALPGIDVVTRPFERLAGIRVDAQRHARRHTRWYTKIAIQTIVDGKTKEVELPTGTHLTRPHWSPDGKHLAFARDGGQGLELWVVDAETAQARRLGSFHVNDVLDAPFTWMPGSQALLVRQARSDGPVPARSTVPTGPVVEDTSGKVAQNRTYQDLLTNADDERMFEHFAGSQLAIVSLDGEASPLSEPGLVEAADPSPDGKYVLVERLQRPFSYTVPYYRFARVIEVLDAKAKVVRRVADLPVADEIPIEGVRTGPRQVHWQPGVPATLVWTEALDEGDPRKEVEHRDRVMSHAAPFADTPEERLRVQHRLSSLDWTSSAGQVLVEEYDRDRRWVTTRIHELDAKGGAPTEPRVLFDRSARDAYADPGVPVTEARPDGTHVVIVDGGSIFLAGDGASPDGDRPFLDRLELATGTKQRLFQSEGDEHVQFSDFVGPDHSAWLVRRESATEPPNFHVQQEGGAQRQLTTFPDPHPQLTGIRKQILSYARRDGVPLSGTLYLPPNYEEGQRLPLVIWAYPLEYNDGDTAGQVRAAPRTFTRLGGTSPLMFLTQGYAVLDDAAMPVVGDPETMNDTFVDQIVWSAEAAIDAAVKAGVADRDRVGVMGHSYGAFMAANLLAHSDLFQAAIARSGAYNRTLTPFGFQSERRTLWEAPQTYVTVSPLFSANRIDEPLLLVHGEIDDNSGTFPLQSQRLFHAMQGTGGTARLVLLPGESHGYVARESVLHVLAESFEWFDRHVKNADPAAAASAATSSAAATVADPARGVEPKTEPKKDEPAANEDGGLPREPSGNAGEKDRAKPAPEPAKPAPEPAKPAPEPAKPASEPAKPAPESAKPESVKPAPAPAKPAPAKPAPASPSAG